MKLDETESKKTIHYMSIEFLIGRNLRNNLWNVELEEPFRKLLARKYVIYVIFSYFCELKRKTNEYSYRKI